MSHSFRPVREIWGHPSSSFLAHDELIDFLSENAEKARTHTEIFEYGEVTSVYIENGDAFLRHFEIGNAIYSGDDQSADSVIHNIKNLASEWRKLIDPNHGSLTFYVD